MRLLLKSPAWSFLHYDLFFLARPHLCMRPSFFPAIVLPTLPNGLKKVALQMPRKITVRNTIATEREPGKVTFAIQLRPSGSQERLRCAIQLRPSRRKWHFKCQERLRWAAHAVAIQLRPSGSREKLRSQYNCDRAGYRSSSNSIIRAFDHSKIPSLIKRNQPII